MLLELRAENYAVIDHAVAEFGPGLNLLTGETGAGKSILIDALVLLLGGKASSDVVRFGAEKAVLGCVFESTSPGTVEAGTGCSSMGHTGFPVTRSNTKRKACLVGCATALMRFPSTVMSSRFGAAGKS